MAKILVKTPLVNIEGDEMTRIIWSQILDKIILPRCDIRLETYDLSIQNRDATDDKITKDAGLAILRHGVGVKCATITADEARVQEFNLKKAWRSPNATIRQVLNGTVFREPIICHNVPRIVPHWSLPIIIARHAFGDIYQAKEILVQKKGKLSIRFTPEDGSTPQEQDIALFDPHADNTNDNTSDNTSENTNDKAALVGIYNTQSSIKAFAHACFLYGLNRRVPVFLSTKNTILKTHDGLFKDTFEDIYNTSFKAQFEEKGLIYQHRLIDDLVAYALRSEGGFLWAAKNYDGDVQSDMVAQGFGSLGLMTSILMNADGSAIETEAAHGTVTRHFRQHQQGFATSTNPIASLFAWTRALAYRGEKDNTPDLVQFTKTLEKACIETVEQGSMTKDLALLIGEKQTWLTTDEFLNAVVARLEALS